MANDKGSTLIQSVNINYDSAEGDQLYLGQKTSSSNAISFSSDPRAAASPAPKDTIASTDPYKWSKYAGGDQDLQWADKIQQLGHGDTSISLKSSGTQNF